jgi:hypothetical protein
MKAARHPTCPWLIARYVLIYTRGHPYRQRCRPVGMVLYTRTKRKALDCAKDQARRWWKNRRRLVTLKHRLVVAEE